MQNRILQVKLSVFQKDKLPYLLNFLRQNLDLIENKNWEIQCELMNERVLS